MIDIVRYTEDVEGMISPNEQRLLYNLAKGCSNVLEIGAYKGKSTICLAMGVKQIEEGVVHTIDPHLDERVQLDFFYNILTHYVEDDVVYHHMPSDDIFNLRLYGFDLCFIDGGHSQAQATRDIDKCMFMTKYGGTVVVHDVVPIKGLTGVYNAVKDVLLNYNMCYNPKLVDTTLYFRVRCSTGVIDKFRKIFILFKILLYAMAHRIGISGKLRKLGVGVCNG